MDEKFVSFIAFESVTARLERTIRRLWLALIVLIMAFFIESMYIAFTGIEETTTITQDVDTGNGSASIVGMGDINAENTSDNN